jgi:hypothetical protein
MFSYHSAENALRIPSRYGLTVNVTSFEPLAPHELLFVAVIEPEPTVWVPFTGLYT